MRVTIVFEQYSPLFTATEGAGGITVAAVCRMCKQEVLRRFFPNIPEDTPEPRRAVALLERRPQAEADANLFMEHLTKQHPERFSNPAS